MDKNKNLTEFFKNFNNFFSITPSENITIYFIFFLNT